MANTLNRAFGYNPSATYKTGGVYKRHLETPNLTVRIIVAGRNEVFLAEVTNVCIKYVLPPVTEDAVVRAWNDAPVQF